MTHAHDFNIPSCEARIAIEVKLCGNGRTHIVRFVRILVCDRNSVGTLRGTAAVDICPKVRRIDTRGLNSRHFGIPGTVCSLGIMRNGSTVNIKKHVGGA